MCKYELYEYLTEQVRIANYNKSICDNASDIIYFEGQKNGYELLICKLRRAKNLKDFIEFAIELNKTVSNLLICRGIAEASGFVIHWLKCKIPEESYHKFGLN